MVFDKDIKKQALKAMGTMKNANEIGTPIDSISGNTKAFSPIQLTTLSANIDKVFAKDESVIVKLKDADKILYIPGFVVEGGGAAPYTIGLAKDITITGVDEQNIAKNIQLDDADNNEGWFFSDAVLGSFAGAGNSTTYGEYIKKIEDITTHANSVRKIKVSSLASSPDAIKKASETTPPTSPDKDSYELTAVITLNGKNITQVKMKSVVPLSFNKEDGGEIAISLATTVFGGKKSRKQKTRKNTMPLQFAPGAKRSYLKRRKSSRK